MNDELTTTKIQLNTFLEQAEQRAFQMALYATKNTDDALDIVQDAMMILTKKYSHKAPNEWGPLFHTITQNKILDWHRRQNVHKKWRSFLPFSNKDEDNDTYENPIENAPELKNIKPDDKLTQERAMASLSNAVKNLPPRQQQAFLLRTWEGLNVAETAAAMNCSQGSVKTHYSRAIHSLREKLEDHI